MSASVYLDNGIIRYIPIVTWVGKFPWDALVRTYFNARLSTHESQFAHKRWICLQYRANRAIGDMTTCATVEEELIFVSYLCARQGKAVCFDLLKTSGHDERVLACSDTVCLLWTPIIFNSFDLGWKAKDWFTVWNFVWILAFVGKLSRISRVFFWVIIYVGFCHTL